jgi:predicted GIY-YIG superfamily endonuclease
VASTPGRWWLYLLRCGDGSLYCGVARDVAARLAQHEAGRGAKYTRGRGPLSLVLSRRCADHGTALRLEHAVKQLARAEKEALVANRGALPRLARRVRARA